MGHGAKHCTIRMSQHAHVRGSGASAIVVRSALMGDILVEAGHDLLGLSPPVCVECARYVENGHEYEIRQACFRVYSVMQRLEKHEHVLMDYEFRVSWNQDRVVC